MTVLEERVVHLGIKTSKKENLLLINPPSRFLLDERVFLPLGIASIAAVAEREGHNVELIDLAGHDDYIGKAVQAVKDSNYTAVGITATSPQFYYAHKLLKAIKEVNPNLKTIIGGSHSSMFSSYRDSLIKRFSEKGLQGQDLEYALHQEDPNFAPLEDFDVIAAGEENSIFAALASNGSKWVDGGVSENLDSLPLPARKFFDVKNYLFDPQGVPKFKINGKASGSLISQRGCPFRCEFCCGRDTKMYHQVRLPKTGILRVHSPERILEELDEINAESGIDCFMFYDDEFNLHPERTTKLCEMLSKRNYSFRGFVKSDLLVDHPEVAGAMKKAGFVEVLTGVESGSDRILGRHLHKRTTPEVNYRAAQICLENDIAFKALTMLGHTSETPTDILATRDWLIKTGKMFYDKKGPGHFTFDLTVFQPYAGCPIWDKAEKNTGNFADQFKWAYHTYKGKEILDPQFGGIYFNKVDFSKEQGFYKGIPGEYKAFIRTKTVSPEQFVAMRDMIEWEVRDRLKMPQLTQVTASMQLEHSMGQTGTSSKS